MPTARGTALDGALVELVEVTACLATAGSVQEALDHLTASAARLVGARVSVAHVQRAGGGTLTATHVEPPRDQQADAFAPPAAWLIDLLLARGGAVRLTADEVGEAPGAERAPRVATVACTMSAPRTGSMGTVLLADPTEEEEFADEDLTVLEQLGGLAAATIERIDADATRARQEAFRFRDDMLAGMSHDMHTPLSVIVGIADSLSEDPDLPREERLEVYATIARQARRLRSLVNQFIDFSRIEADRPLTLDLNPLDVVTVVDSVVPLFTHQREIIVGADEDLPPAMADQERLEQVLINLISNAVKYSDQPVRVVARGIPPDVIIDVVDEGPGLSDEELTEIFGKFRRGRAASGTRGTGLGLYISRALTEAQGGELHAMSAGIGSRFRVRLPMAPRS